MSYRTDQSSGNEEVILVDEHDNEIGLEDKLQAHRAGKLHRAFSIFVFDGTGNNMLLQRRSEKKYHFGGLWSNTCCSHPRKGEALSDAARRRLREEFGFETELEHLFAFIYRASDPKSGLTEHEFDHVFCGRFDGQPRPNLEEIDEWRWVGLPELVADVESNPHHYTPWFVLALNRVTDGVFAGLRRRCNSIKPQ